MTALTTCHGVLYGFAFVSQPDWLSAVAATVTVSTTVQVSATPPTPQRGRHQEGAESPVIRAAGDVESRARFLTALGMTASVSVFHRPSSLRLPFGWPWLLAGLLALVTFLSLAAVRRRALGWLFATALVVVGVWAACGGGGGSTPPPTPTPAVSLSLTSLTFGSQTVGTTSAAQSASSDQQRNAALSISSIAIGGANPWDFAQTNTCGASVAAGANCTIRVTFTPSAAGSRGASLTITDNASPSAQTVG